MSTVSGRDLLVELGGVVPPAGSGFSVRDVGSAPGYKIGRGSDGVIALLTPPDAAPEAPTRLRTLQLDPRIHLRLEDQEGTVTEADHGLVQLWLHDDDLLEPFLGVAAAIVRLLGATPAPGQVSAGLRRLVKIFDPAQPARGSILGLWAELLLMAESPAPEALVDAWHAHVDSRFDYSGEGSRLEVKATTRDDRVHQFNLRQLLPVNGATVVVASIMTTETNLGTSIADLVGRLEARLPGDAPRQVRVHQMVAETLGVDWARHVTRLFDEREALESLALLDPADVPQVDPGPPEVQEVRLTVDCTDVPRLDLGNGLGALLPSRASAP